MSAEVKRVKLLTLCGLVLGLGIFVFGIALALGNAVTPSPFILMGEGFVTLAFGARGALIANVPARIGKLATLALVALLAQVACVCALVATIGPDHVQQNVVPVVVSAAPALLCLIIAVGARSIAKRAER